ncbi:39S ribosomal protein L51, mitochondrial [Saxophila tyrrhenica]|uniref:Large ribosomal subunit protein mL43 n=1 Tax=Saxophila tyrrhenica TaxID=1690608 RepID=A0AAV9P7S5_9PEZI|nr:39S ribosomal protein L51, mitochondrial [Saxophila tyrrhenica]
MVDVVLEVEIVVESKEVFKVLASASAIWIEALEHPISSLYLTSMRRGNGSITSIATTHRRSTIDHDGPGIARRLKGAGAFVLQCKRLEFHYCDWAGSSRGMNAFLQTKLPAFARENPGVEVSVSPRPGKHPVIRGHFINGREKAICVRNMTPHEILDKALYMRSNSGEKMNKGTKAGRNVVRSNNESVRGVWDPYHGTAFKV